jgi:hypothetical protein
MSSTDLIGRQADESQPASLKPRAYPCPPCATTGKRQRVHTRRVAHAAARPRHAWLVAAVGAPRLGVPVASLAKPRCPGGHPREEVASMGLNRNRAGQS